MAWLAASGAGAGAGAASGAGTAAGTGAASGASMSGMASSAMPTVGGSTMAASSPSLLGSGSGLVNTTAPTLSAPSFGQNFMSGMANRGNPLEHFANGEYGKGLGSMTMKGGGHQEQPTMRPVQGGQQTPMNAMERYNQLYRFRR